ncbi:hypothetical protein EXIGLDRAFT_772176 [Exidia glandulosa HHB12029]|uniref:Uncharacterized protein n=1 Tax=Exidia glandulosa HHB12029 TaxID=1314781 RepID=A0A165FGF6_EXIGL|nr:hypothetical protein EXIGLDRAFT_772176 [Exidia glandulosa HHB12029]
MSTPVHDNESSPTHEEANRMADSFSAAAEAMAQAAPNAKFGNEEPAHALSQRASEIAALVVSDLKAHPDHLRGKHEAPMVPGPSA